MKPRLIRLGRAAVAVALVSGCAAVAACGGGGGGGGGGPPSVPPPTSVTYPVAAATFETDAAIAPNVPTVGGGVPTAFVVAPSLPTGLLLDATTGAITGTPTTPKIQTVYTVTASNAGGSAQGTVDLTVILAKAQDLTAKSTFTDADIRFFLGRTHFGGKTSDFDAVKAVGIPAYVDTMVDNANATNAALEQAAANLLVNNSDPVNLQGGFPSVQQVSQYWLQLMLNNPNPFQEVLAFFWHDHFASSDIAIESDATHWMVEEIALWRKGGAGNLRQLVLDMARSPMMLFFLDGVINSKAAPNENFGRELWELFTLGRDNNYTQADIVQAAKALTGYRTRTNATTNQREVVFDTTLHDPNAKTVLGTVIPAQNATDDYKAVVDITFDTAYPNGIGVAEFIGRKLFEHFCYEHAPDVPVKTIATMLRNNGYELKPVLKALFKSEAFYSGASRAGLVKGPLEHVIGFARSTGLYPLDAKGASDPAAWPAYILRTLDGGLAGTGQRPGQPPSVNGWPVTDEWLSAQNMLDRANLVDAAIVDRVDQANANGGVDLAKALLPVAATSATTVDALAALLNVTLTPGERTQLITYLDTSYNANTQVTTPSPFDPNNNTHVAERVRGLLYILSQHPAYTIR